MKAEQEIQRNENKIAAEALTDPKQAITDAMALPEIRQSLFFAEGTSPRARVLLAIAKEIGKKNPNATVDALSRAQVSGPDIAGIPGEYTRRRSGKIPGNRR